MSIKTIYKAEGVPAPVGAYSPATVYSGVAYISGQIALDPDSGKLVEGGAQEQVDRVLKNCSAALAAVGSSWDKVLMTTIFLDDISHGPVVNEAYNEVFSGDHRPARQTVAVKALPMGVCVEISLIAAAG